MKENSYDAKELRFGIIVSEYLSLNRKGLKDIPKDDYNKFIEELFKMKLEVIDFDNIDGLTIGEIREVASKILPEDMIVFIMYNKVEWNFNNTKNTNISSKQTIIIRFEDFDDNLKIDDIITGNILNNYESYNYTTKKYAKCFLERYKYGNKEETDKKLMQYKK